MLIQKKWFYFELRAEPIAYPIGRGLWRRAYGGWSIRLRFFFLSLYLRRRSRPKEGKRWIVGTMDRAQVPLLLSIVVRRIVEIRVYNEVNAALKQHDKWLKKPEAERQKRADP